MLLSKDVQFKNLQLLIIDDEQKLGVKQKERLRQMKASLDVLSLSATPIPRTIYLALSAFKNISLIQTPPIGRQSVETKVLPYNEKIVKKTSESQRAANKKYREKMKENQEFKDKQKIRMQNYYINNREKYNEYQREYQRTVYYPNKKNEELKNKYIEKETELFLPLLIQTTLTPIRIQSKTESQNAKLLYK